METMNNEQSAEGGLHAHIEKLKAESLEMDIKLKRMFAETAERFKETDKQIKETAEQIKETAEQIKETAEQMKITDAKLDKLWATVKRVTKNVGGLNNSMGSLIETLIGAGICDKFEELKLERVFRQVPIYNEKNRLLTDIDLLLSNTIRGMGVEIKKELNKIEDVDMHLKRLELIRKYPPAEIQINNKELLGAMAGGMVDPDVMAYAHSKGLYVLELSGESVRLVPSPEGFTPRVW
jgi:chromosome segregation ATPase